jgi:hypothetical protein
VTPTKDQVIGANIQRLRGSQSQQDIADAMRERGHKWSQATVWSVEKGERAVRLAEAADLGEILSNARGPMDLLRPMEQTEIAELWGRLVHAIADAGKAIEVVENRREELIARAASVDLVSLDPRLARSIRELTEQSVEQIFFAPPKQPSRNTEDG